MYKFEEIKDELEINATPTGALLDERVKELKDLDYLHEESGFASAGTPTWIEKDFDDLKRYSPRNQKSSLSCVANGGAIELEAAELKETGKQITFSHKDIYIRRSNRPYGGMNMDDLFKIMRDGGAYESQVPSMNLGENDINKEYPITPAITAARAKHGALASLTIQNPTMDKVASVLEEGIPVIVFWYFKGNEFWRQSPKILDSSLDLYEKDTVRHQAAFVDFTLIDGKKHLVVQDSASVGSGYGPHKDLRFISKEFFDKRNYAVGYSLDKANLDFTPPTKPKYQFIRTLKVGMTGEDVKALQTILVYEKCMVLASPTTYFGGMTFAGVKKLQEKYKAEILTPIGLSLPTGIVASQTIKWLNKNFG